MITLKKHQEDAISRLKDNMILEGGVGSGKTLTSLSYYKKFHSRKRLIVITTAYKRDTHDWEDEAALVNAIGIVVDSWNNIHNYEDEKDCFFIFDEQRIVGYGVWVHSFIKIAKNNKWLLLTATPADEWKDYMPVFIAKGYYKNKTHFYTIHCELDPYRKYESIKNYKNINTLHELAKEVTVIMQDQRHTNRIEEHIKCDYDDMEFMDIYSNKWNVFEQKPIENYSQMMEPLRRSLSNHPSRKQALAKLIKWWKRVIVFYHHRHEYEIIRNICEEVGRPYSTRNGDIHENVLDAPEWCYIVQYTSGAEGWNCIETNIMIFYSPTYSYKVDEQAKGRIDRMNTKYKDLYYYYLLSNAPLDRAIRLALMKKRNFNVNRFMKSYKPKHEGELNGDGSEIQWLCESD